MRVLFLSRWYPYPPDNGAKIRIFNLLRQLAQRHDVSLVTFAEDGDRVDDASRAALGGICSDVRVVPYRPYHPTSGRAVLGLLSPTPRYLVDTHSPELAAAIDELTRRRGPDLVVASQLAMAPYVRESLGGSWLLEELEVGVFRDAASRPLRGVAGLRPRLTWTKLAGYLRRTLPAFAACTVVSETERQHVATALPNYADVHVVPNAVDVAACDGAIGEPEPGSLVLAGSLTYGPNREGLAWLLREVYPRLMHGARPVRLRVTGSTRGVDLDELPSYPSVEYTGHVPDVRPVVARSCVSVVPLRSGGGTRLKILESMALGTPVVATSKGAEGLDVQHGENIVIADDPVDFAAWVEEIARNPELRARLAQAGRELVRSRYDWDVVGPRFCALAEDAAHNRSARIVATAS